MRTAPDPYFPTHGDSRFSVAHYHLTLQYKVATNRLAGRARLTIRPRVALDDLRLDLSGLHVSAVTVDGAAPRKVAHTGRALTVRLARRLDAGAVCEVVIDYGGKPHGVPGPFGPAGWEELSDGVLVASQPYGAPSWFPCNDSASDKATYRFEVTTESAYLVVANGVLADRVRRGGTTTWVYDEGRPMAPYLAALHIGRYVAQPLASGRPPIDVVAPASFDVTGTPFDLVPAMVGHLSEWFGPYPFAEYRCVVAADDLEIPLEAQGLASFGRNHARHGWDNERLVVHELAHQWFGNSVTAGLGRDIWLHEGFACYTEWLWSEHRGLASADQRAREHWARLEASETPLADPGVRSMFDDWVYKRGALTLHALRSAIGEEAFFGMLRAWTSERADAVVSTAEFVAHAQRHAKVDLVPLFRAWLERPEVPPLP